MRHRTLGRSGAVAVAGALALLLAGCSSTSSTSAPPAPAATSAGAGVAPVGALLEVPEGLDDAPFDAPREVQVPAGWSVSLWARVDEARLGAWAPDGRLLGGFQARDGSRWGRLPDGASRFLSRLVRTGGGQNRHSF